MAFRFTGEDFERYVKTDEHGGRHIWHYLEEQLRDLFGITFKNAPYIARGDRLQTLWLAPRGTPRSQWSNQAQFFLERSIAQKQLTFGLMVECASLSETAQKGFDSDRDGERLIEQLEHNPDFANQLDNLISQADWAAGVHEWGKGWHSCQNSSELLGLLKSMPQEQGWGAHIQRKLSATQAVAAGEDIVNQIMAAYQTTRSLWEAVIPEADREFLRTGKLPANASPAVKPQPTSHAQINVCSLLDRYFSAQALAFTLWQIATFYAALKTKGFVILSGLSGTGKTKLAQYFAELMPDPEVQLADGSVGQEFITLQVQPYMLKHTRMIIPTKFWNFVDVPSAGQANEIRIGFDGQGHTCRLTHADYGSTKYLQLMLRGDVRKWFLDNFQEGQTVELEPIFDEDQFVGFDLRKPQTRSTQKRSNYHFAAVRPDWRDAKPLLGYYNPLTQAYEFTDFLRFILQAEVNYRDRANAMPHFVILDEMNLARVEYYFADFLSVLESGREDDGWTKEALRFQYPPESEIEGEAPPRELRLPPNLYVVGTVNVDETTHAFSPKVLDRAFTIEMTEVDFGSYPLPQEGFSTEEKQALMAVLLPDFSREGRFARVEKEEIAAFANRHDDYRVHLQRLNSSLRAFDLHFGYRVFDEIMAFLGNVEGPALVEGFAGLDDAFDTAVLMKVLPKFHGPKSRLAEPLRAVLAWAHSPTSGDLAQDTRDVQACQKLRGELEAQLDGQAARNCAYPRTALKVVRMLVQLHATGFASFA